MIYYGEENEELAITIPEVAGRYFNLGCFGPGEKLPENIWIINGYNETEINLEFQAINEFLLNIIKRKETN